MTENFSWSANFGRWMGIPVRIHLFLFLFVVLLFGAEWNSGGSNLNFFAGTAMVTFFVLIGSILIHEMAHVFAIANLGGHVNNLLLMPWGGNSDFVLPQTPVSRTIVHLAGPFINGAIFLFCMALLVQSEHSTLAQLINPFEPHWFNTDAWQVSLIKITSWVNFQLMIFNLIPCFPFDGAQAVRSIIDSINVDLPRYRIETAIKLIGNLSAFSIIGLAWLCREYDSGPIQPTWMILLIFGIVLIFAARHSLHVETQVVNTDWDEMEDMEYESLYNETSFFDFSNEDNDNTAYSQWLNEKQEARREDELRKEKEEDRRADEILQKLHGDGIKSLTEEEKSILDRVSERIRRQRQQGV